MSNIIFHSCPSLKDAKLKKDPESIYELIDISSFLIEKCKKKKAVIITHGCQANYRDSEILKGILSKCGYSFTDDVKDADLVLINTCAVRENAENKVLGEIGNLKVLKSKKDLVIAITGCMAMEEVMVDTITKIYTHVDIIFGTHDTHLLPSLLEEHFKSNKRIVNVNSSSFKIFENLPSIRDSSFKAFVNITYGCDNFCTYCIVPYTRGRQRSRKIEDILNECKSLVDQGYKEITLLGQNVDTYGLDLKDGSNFSILLDKVASLGMPRLSFLTSHPYYFSTDIIDIINKHKNILRYIHLPVQSGSDRILKLMGRKYNSSTYINQVKLLKEKCPGIAISTDIIVGFPGESEEDFEGTLKVVSECKYDSAFTFIYSKRSGTPAATFKDDVTYKEKVIRFKKLTKLLENSIEENNKKYLNKTFDVLVDSLSKNDETVLSGRLNTNKIVNFKGSKDLIGKIVKVKIESSHIHFLMGKLE